MDKASFIRVLAFIASFFAYFNIHIPESTYELVAGILYGIFGLYVAYKNNYLFGRGEKQKEVLEQHGLYKKVK